MLDQNKIWLNQFLHNCSSLNYSPFTLKTYTSVLNCFINWVESTSVSNLNLVNSDTISSYKNFLLISKSKNTVSHALVIIKSFYGFLKQNNEDHNNIFNRPNPVKNKLHRVRLKDKDITPIPILKEHEWLALNKAIKKDRDRLIILILYYGGLRLSELNSLNVHDFNHEDGTITFFRKGGDRHCLKIDHHEIVFEAFKDYVNHRKEKSEILLLNRQGKRFQERKLFDLIKKLLRQAGLRPELSPHSFRRACATRLYKETLNIILVKSYLNHSDITTTQRYIEI